MTVMECFDSISKFLERNLTGLISVLLGAALLFAGRRLFWLFVGALGFIVGMQVAALIPQLSEATVLLVGLVVGVIFALLAIFLQRLAMGLAGFVAGGFILTTLFARLGVESLSNWVVYILGGLAGIVLVMLLFDWALIIFSSMAGAALLLQSFSTQTPAGVLIFFLLALTGIIIQGGLLLRERRGKR
jgi:hypothetical protein